MSTQAIQRGNGAAPLVLLGNAETDLQLVRDLYAKHATDAEFRLFIYQANTYQLDPMLRQIWCVKNPKRPDLPASIFAGLAGLLHIAHRSGQFDGIESEGVYNDKGELVSAWAVVHRKDAAHPFRVSVLLREYKPAYAGSLWDSKPETMLKKVAKCQALREAFDVSGLYDPAEMMVGRAIDEQTGEILSTAREVTDAYGGHYTVEMITDYLNRHLGIADDDTKTFIEALTEGRYRKLVEMDDAALQRFGAGLNRWRDREDVEWFRQHGTHPLDQPVNRPPAQPSASPRPPAHASAQGRPASAPPASERPLRAATGDTHETAPAQQASGDPLQQVKGRVWAQAQDWGWGVPELETVLQAHVVKGGTLGQASRAQMEALEAVMRDRGVAALPSLAAVGTP